MRARILLTSLALGLAACGGKSAEMVPAVISSDARAELEADARDTLDAFYEASARANFEAWISLFTEDAMFYGTDATEAWPREEFASDVEEGFATGKGWGFEIRDRKVTVSLDGQTAWFAELSHFNNTDYTLRPTGVLVRQNGDWKIAQLVMGVPFPNEIYAAFLNGLQATENGAENETVAIDAVLDSLHHLASGGDVDAYLSIYTDDAIFIGTDATERWTMADLRAYAEPAFADGSGWTYTPRERHIVLSPMKNVAWFDEILDQEKYGTSRGTGTLVRTEDGWKIMQYHLTFPIPNDVAEEVTSIIINAEKAGE